MEFAASINLATGAARMALGKTTLFDSGTLANTYPSTWKFDANTKIYLCSDLGSNPFSCSTKKLTIWYQYIATFARICMGGVTRNYFSNRIIP